MAGTRSMIGVCTDVLSQLSLGKFEARSLEQGLCAKGAHVMSHGWVFNALNQSFA